MSVVFLVGTLLILGLFAYGLKQRPRGPGPPPRKSRNAIERFWDTPEHSDAWDDERPEQGGLRGVDRRAAAHEADVAEDRSRDGAA